ncbi:hypothetical protein C7H19_15295 [Aphanothece hegewaldii CCALA 016]|uniref:Cytochrome P450 n=2 Tax=Aphanothece TaxID=1121 RepID=A0A2T1LVN0_9CHRO|nr:hypothetical protein C7H19_15295 [Aphanothece hegewaldii CCALA 016]
MTQSSENEKKFYNLQGEVGYPILGEASQLFSKNQYFWLERFYRYGSIFKTRIFNMNAVCLAEPDAYKLILKDEAHKFSSNQGWWVLKPFFERGLLLQDGQEHQRSKRLISPAFTRGSLAHSRKNIEETVERYLIEHIENEKIFSPLPFFRKLTLLIICRLILGYEQDQEQKVNKLSQLFLDVLAGVSSVVRLNMPLTKYRKALQANEDLQNYLILIISERRQNKLLSGSSSLLDILLEQREQDGDYLLDREIASQISAIFFGGHETTANLLCSSLVQLEYNTSWQEKLRSELKQNSSKSFLSFYNDSLFNNIINECLRLNPPIYTIPRKVIKSFEVADCKVPEGWYIILSPLLTHRIPYLYSDPEAFDPLRFSPPREEHKKHPFGFISFGGGAHKCIGQDLVMLELEIILTYLLREYFWKSHNQFEYLEFLRHTAKCIKLLKISLYS